MLLWEITGVNSFGDPVVGEPEELRVRWENGQKDIRKPDGTFVTVDATVMVTQDIKIGSTVWLAPNDDYSALTQFLGSGSGDPDQDIMQVVTSSKIPDIKNRNVRRVLGVARFKEDRPEVG